MYCKVFKPVFDFVVGLILILFLSPLLFVLSMILLITNNGTPLFFQTRVGYKGKVFKIIKFKSMSDKTDERGTLLPDSKRLTKIGSFLRKLSLDELPQLINVIKGDLSIIGPRPLLVQYLPYYTDEQIKRHDVKPGITGWAQVHGRQAISFEKRFEYDIWYVDNLSFRLDLKILLLTLKKVIKSEGVIQDQDCWKG